MTFVDVSFLAPENQFGVELKVLSQGAWDRYQESRSNDDWEYFLEVFRDQMRDHILKYTDFDEVYES